jgi:Fe-S-cluster-containing hydrogenase component 2
MPTWPKSTFDEKGKHAVIDPEKCTLCWNCVRSCFYGAMAKSEEQVHTLTENCIGCELCYSVCPFDAVSFEAICYSVCPFDAVSFEANP